LDEAGGRERFREERLSVATAVMGEKSEKEAQSVLRLFVWNPGLSVEA